MLVFSLAVAAVSAGQEVCDSLPLPWAEGFEESTAMPACWTSLRNFDVGDAPHISAERAHNGTGSLVIYPGTLAGSHYGMAIAPPLADSVLAGRHLRFYMWSASTASSLEVGFCRDTGRYTRAFTPIDTLHAAQANRWHEVDIDLTPFEGLGVRLAFRLQRSLQPGSAPVYVDDISVEDCGVSSLWVSHVGHDRLTLHFDRYGHEPITVTCGDVIFPDATSPLLVEGLAPLTTYTLAAACEGGESREVEASTLAGPSMTTTYYQSFSRLPDGWLYPLSAAPSVAGGVMTFAPTAADTVLAVLPLYGADLGDLTLALRLRGTGSARLVVGVMDFAGEVGTFAAVDTLVPLSAWSLKSSSLAAYQGQGRYLALKAMGSGSLDIDDLRVAHSMVATVRIYGLTDHSVTIAWDTLGTPAAVELRLGDSSLAVGSNPLLIDGLSAATSYVFLLHPQSVDDTCLLDLHSFTTLAHEVSLPYCSDFESATLPPGWVVPDGTAQTVTTAYAGSRALRVDAGSVVVTPQLSGVGDVLVEFRARGTGTLQLGLVDNPYAPFQQVHEVGLNSEWNRFVLPVSGLSGRSLALRGSAQFSVDNFAFVEQSVDSLAVVGIDRQAAMLRWLSPDSVWVEFRAVATADADFSVGTGTVVTALDSLVLDGLVPNTWYAVHVSAAGACFPLTAHFRTLSDEASFPLCENFEGYASNAFPAAWRRLSAYGTYPIVSTERSYGGTASLRFSATATTPTVALLPDFPATTAHLSLAFWALCTRQASGAWLVVGQLADVSDIASFQPLDTISLSGLDQWRPFRLDLGDHTRRLALMLVGGRSSETRLFIDNLCVEACAIYDARAAASDSSLSFSWQSAGVDSVVYTLTGDGLTLRDTAASSPVVLGGLSANASYQLTLQALCECGGYGAAYVRGWGSGSSVASDQRASFAVNVHPPVHHAPWCATFDALSAGLFPTFWTRHGAASVTDRNFRSSGRSLSVSDGTTFVLPPFDTVSPLALTLHLFSLAGEADAVAVVGLMSDPDSIGTFVPVDTLRQLSAGQWERHVVTMPHLEARFMAVQALAPLFVDDVSVDTTVLTSASVTADGLVEWQTWGSVSQVALECVEAGRDRTSGTTRFFPASPVRLDSLLPATSYDIYLTPEGNCMPLMVSLGSPAAIPYCEDFDASLADGMPSRWTVAAVCDGSPSLVDVAANRCLSLKGGTSSRAVVVLPPLDADSQGVFQLSLSVRAASAQASLVVGVVDSLGDINSFSPVDTVAVADSWSYCRFPLAGRLGGGRRLALTVSAPSGVGEVWLDSVAVVRGNTPVAATLSSHSVGLSSLASGYFLDYVPAGSSEWTTVRVDTTCFVLDGLLADTAYLLRTHVDSLPTCVPPLTVATSPEASLPFCADGMTLGRLVLPDPVGYDLESLHLYLSLEGDGEVQLGTLEHWGDWQGFVPRVTVEAPFDGSLNLAGWDGRFLALNGDGVALSRLVLSPCPLPELELRNDNTVAVSGSGWLDFGEGRFFVAADTVLGPLADTTLFLVNRYCSSADTSCLPPVALLTTYRIALPYCSDSAGGLMPVVEADTLWADYRLPDGRRRHTRLDNAGGRPLLPPVVYDLRLEACDLPLLEFHQFDADSVLLSWPDTVGGFFVEYAPAGTAQGGGEVVAAVSSPLVLRVQPDTDYHFWTLCDPSSVACREPQRLHTLPSPVDVPYCQAVGDVLLAGWRVSDGLWVLPPVAVDSLRRLNVTLFAHGAGRRVVLGAMSDADDTATFDPLASFALGETSARQFCALDDYYGAGRFLALRLDAGAVVDSVAVAACGAYAFALAERDMDYAVFTFRSQGSPTVTVEYGPRGFESGTGTVLHPSSSPFTVSGLSPLTAYAFYLGFDCDSESCPSASHTDTLVTFTPQGTGDACFDYTDLASPNVSCTWGSYSNPMEHVGIVDWGCQSSESRHTIHFDTAERDSRTGGLLRTVPEGSSASVRLGNWTAGGYDNPQAESITYVLTVNTDEADLLLLRYAAVLQDPEHSPSLQPRFRLQILDDQGHLVDSCGAADFIANYALGWNVAPGDVLWKDWTTVGLDLTPYNGQTVLVRLTTNDCGEGSHFGYAYFTLSCASRTLQSEGCSFVPDNRFTVPAGFTYRWYSNHSDSTLSTEQSIFLRSDNSTTYFCDLAFVDNPGCRFTMSAFAGARFPLALFDTALVGADCQFDLTLTNRSTISSDGVTPLGTGEPVESLRWLLPDGSTASASSVSYHLPDTGVYRFGLVASIANHQCLDTLVRDIRVDYLKPRPAIVGPDTRCDNLPPTELTLTGAVEYRFLGASQPQQSLLVAPVADTTVTAITLDGNGCVDTLSHTLAVHPAFAFDESDTLCSDQTSYGWHDTLLTLSPATAPVTARLPRHTVLGCDSVYTLHLVRHAAYDVHHALTRCHEDSTLFFDTLLRTSGLYVHSGVTRDGCDSIVSLALTVRPPARAVDSVEACDSLRWIDGRLYTASVSGPLDTLATPQGCDSVVTLALAVHPSYRSLERDTVCEGDTCHWRGMALTLGGLHSDTLRSVHGCDSIFDIRLRVNPTAVASIEHDYSCLTLDYTLVGSTNAPLYQWSAEPADSLLDSSAADGGLFVMAHPYEPTVYTLSLSYPGTKPCPSEARLALNPAERPQARMRVSPQSLDGGQREFTLADVGRDYAWRCWLVNGDELTSRSPMVNVVAPEASDTVWVALVVGDGHCVDTAIAFVTVDLSGLAVPNLFAPGAGGDNGRFQVRGHAIAGYEILVFSRGGQLVFSSTDINQPWDGTGPDGRPCPTGSYVYRIRFSTLLKPESVQQRVGTVTLVR